MSLVGVLSEGLGGRVRYARTLQIEERMTDLSKSNLSQNSYVVPILGKTFVKNQSPFTQVYT